MHKKPKSTSSDERETYSWRIRQKEAQNSLGLDLDHIMDKKTSPLAQMKEKLIVEE